MVHHSILDSSHSPFGCVLSVFATAASAQERLDVVATTGMIADAAREVGGDLVRYLH
jgi:ABC-type Zn uptake system ZnuABC Zn-binding protein ZnuA